MPRVPNLLFALGMRTVWRYGSVTLCLTSAFDCSSSLSRPPSGPLPADAMVEVPYPPPPGRVETVPAQKKSAEVWIDGQWEWSGRDWRWVPGTWMVPPPHAYFTPWTTKHDPDGRLLFAPAAWRGKDGKPVDAGSNEQTCALATPATP